MKLDEDPIARRLAAERQIPRVAWHARARRRLMERVPTGRPARLRLLVAAYAAAGAALLGIAASAV
jgi:hypothetical protein